jgi:hypothetical protein
MSKKIPKGLLYFPFCPLSRKEKETQRPLRLKRLPLHAGGVGGKKPINEHRGYHLQLRK